MTKGGSPRYERARAWGFGTWGFLLMIEGSGRVRGDLLDAYFAVQKA